MQFSPMYEAFEDPSYFLIIYSTVFSTSLNFLDNILISPHQIIFSLQYLHIFSTLLSNIFLPYILLISWIIVPHFGIWTLFKYMLESYPNTTFHCTLNSHHINILPHMNLHTHHFLLGILNMGYITLW